MVWPFVRLSKVVGMHWWWQNWQGSTSTAGDFFFSISRSDKFLTQKSATFQSVSHCVHKSQALGQQQLLYASAVMISMSMEFMNFGTSNYTTVHCVSFWSLHSMKIIWVLNFTKQKSMKFMNFVTSNYIGSVFDGNTAWKCFFFSKGQLNSLSYSQYCKRMGQNYLCNFVHKSTKIFFFHPKSVHTMIGYFIMNY